MTIRAFAQRLQNTTFGRRIMQISAGVVFGQLILVLFSPILTRLFSPSDFGAFAVFLSTVSIATIFASLRYEFAATMAKSDRQARQLQVFITELIAVNTAIACLFLMLINEYAFALDILASHWIIVLIFTATVINAVNNTMMYFCIEKQLYHVNAVGLFIQYALQAVLQTALGLLGFGFLGLILGFLLSVTARLIYVLVQLRRAKLQLYCVTSLSESLSLAARHWRYPVFNGLAALMLTSSQMLPALLIASLYDLHFAGIFALCQRVLGVPVRAVSEAASQVFLGTASKLETARRNRLYWRTLTVFAFLAIIGGAVLWGWGKPALIWVFGETWADVGTVMQILLPFYLIRFVVVPVSQILNITNAQRYHLWIAILNFAGMGFSFALGYFSQLEILTTITLYSAFGTCVFTIYLLLTMMCVRH